MIAVMLKKTASIFINNGYYISISPIVAASKVKKNGCHCSIYAWRMNAWTSCCDQLLPRPYQQCLYRIVKYIQLISFNSLKPSDAYMRR